MPILSKSPPPPPPPAPIELTPEQLEMKRLREEQEKAKREKQRRLDEARKRLGKLSPQLIEDVRLLCDAFIDEIAMRDYRDPVTGKTFGQPFEAVRRDKTIRAPNCPCSQYLINSKEPAK